jgi:uncharacterized protein (TIGR03437 family)
MIQNLKPFVTSAICAIIVGRVWAQAPRPVTLDIEWENSVGYLDDVPDPSKLVTSPGIPTLNLRNFMRFVAIADIISVNGKPAKGTWVLGGRLVQVFRSPMPGQAIGDLAVRGSMADVHLEILDNDGTPVGTIMTSGFTGGNAPPGLTGFCNLAVIGGTGAFQGVTGAVASPNFSTRATSMAEDPASRRINGGTRGHFFAYLISTASPEIVGTASGPAVFHTDFSPVTAARPARAGETLILTATGLGPTRPGLIPGTPFPQSPLQEINSPLDVTVNGKPADVLNKFGWPGTTDTYRLDIRVPDGTAPGMAGFQVTAAFITGREVKIPVQ